MQYRPDSFWMDSKLIEKICTLTFDVISFVCDQKVRIGDDLTGVCLMFVSLL